MDFNRCKTVTMAVRDLVPSEHNPRKPLKPGDPRHATLLASLARHGCVQPPVFNTRSGRLVAGHQRCSVLRQLGQEAVDVVVIDVPEAQERELMIGLNQIAGEWDQAKLATLLAELTTTPEFELGATGLLTADVDRLLAEHAPRIDPVGDPAEPGEVDHDRDPITQPGDLIELGPHRLLCGDSTNPEHVRRLMGGERAVLFATDPPYCVGYDGTNHPTSKAGDQLTARTRSNARNKDWSDSYGVTWDDAEPNEDLYDGFVAAARGEAITTNAAWYCWHASRHQAMVERVWERHHAFVHAQIIWAKSRPVLTRSWYSWMHEPCLFGWQRPPHGRAPHRNRGEPVLGTVWSVDGIPSGARRPDHPTPKPLELFEIPIRQHTRLGEVCYEPFAGSGTQLIAAHRLQRRCFAIEISPRYCDVIVRRFIATAGAASVDADLARRYAPRNPRNPRNPPKTPRNNPQQTSRHAPATTADSTSKAHSRPQA